MKKLHLKSLLSVFGIAAISSIFAQPFPTTRDPLKWPFAPNSIWNMPIGSSAMYSSANLEQVGNVFPDENILIFSQTSLMVPIYKTTADWDSGNRCGAKTNTILDSAPIPNTFSTDPGYYGLTPNQAAAILLKNGRTIKQNQPFHKCGLNGSAVSGYRCDTADIYGTGIFGAHGGSGLSSLGGTIRLGELVHNGIIRHAIQFGIYCLKDCYYNSSEGDGKPGFRWPAKQADSYAAANYKGSNQHVQMGSLLALPDSSVFSSMQTEPGRILARALYNYGAYVVDDAAWDAVNISLEWGTNGRVLEEFKSAWGYGFQQQSPKSTGLGNPSADSARWGKDVMTLLSQLYVVTNNGPDSIGGGGTPRQPLAPAIGNVMLWKFNQKKAIIAGKIMEHQVYDVRGRRISLSGLSSIKPINSLPPGIYFTKSNLKILSIR